MTFTYCMASTCPMRGDCARHENDAGRHCVFRTYADFSEESIREGGKIVSCPFFMDRETTTKAA